MWGSFAAFLTISYRKVFILNTCCELLYFITFCMSIYEHRLVIVQVQFTKEMNKGDVLYT
jgi:hypothetical protein